MPTTDKPATMLDALLRGDLETVDRHSSELDQDDASEWLRLIATAFALAVHGRFETDTDVREITTFIREVRARYDTEGNRDLPPLVGEALVRGALGETDLIADIDQEASVSAQLILLYAMVESLSDDERDAFVAEAVQMADVSL
ncbi:MAG: hypothetical protein ACRDT8_14370 [Micromonosporaceae bacterium]